MRLWLLACLACTGDAPIDDPTKEPTGDTALPVPTCPTFGEPEAVGVVSDPTLTELSGLVRAGGRLWTHNDSGGAVLLGLSDTGAVVQQVSLDGVVLADWEDIAVRGDRLWLADVGDNLAIRERVFLHEIEVPTPEVAGVAVRTRTVSWPGGPVDSEAMFADPIGGELLLMSKVLDGVVTVARLPDPDGDDGSDPVELEPVATVVFGEGGVGDSALITGADISPDGRFVVVRTYLSAWAFPRVPGEPWSDTFDREPCEVPTGPEGQGEAIAWDHQGIWTVSEGTGVPLHRTSVDAAE